MAESPEKTPDKPPISAKELLERYAKGERHFRGAYLVRANLSHANLSGANLSGAYVIRANLNSADLTVANLSEANLTDANLIGANLSHAHVSSADLSGANLSGADLIRADLIRAYLSGADLIRANLSHANLCGAYLSGANLSSANLSSANLNGATFNRAKLGGSQLGRVELIALCHADPPVEHEGPSVIDFESITLSLLAPNLEKFLISAGIPAIAAQYMIESAQAVKGSVWDMMQSVFISYGTPDLAFATRLKDALHANGVRTFFFPEHAEPGKALHETMREGIKKHDRVILICSKPSLKRNGVLVEIEESLRREGKQAGEMILIPVALDDFIYGKKWRPRNLGTRDALQARVVADFQELDKDPNKFGVEFSKVLNVLKKKHVVPQTHAAAGVAAKSAKKQAPKKATVAKKARKSP